MKHIIERAYMMNAERIKDFNERLNAEITIVLKRFNISKENITKEVISDLGLTIVYQADNSAFIAQDGNRISEIIYPNPIILDHDIN